MSSSATTVAFLCLVTVILIVTVSLGNCEALRILWLNDNMLMGNNPAVLVTLPGLRICELC